MCGIVTFSFISLNRSLSYLATFGRWLFYALSIPRRVGEREKRFKDVYVLAKYHIFSVPYPICSWTVRREGKRARRTVDPQRVSEKKKA